MILAADFARIEKLHQAAEDLGDTSFEHHMRATLLRAYRELAQERDEWRRLQHEAGRALESRIRECDRLRASARGTPGDLEIYCSKCGQVLRAAQETSALTHSQEPGNDGSPFCLNHNGYSGLSEDCPACNAQKTS